MDRMITATEANQRFSELLRDVASGESFTVTSRGRPVARVTPVADDRDRRQEAWDKLLEMSRAMPVLFSGSWTREDLYERRPDE